MNFELLNSTDRIAHLESWLKEDPADPFIPYAIALEYYNQDNLLQAKDRLQELSHAHPNYLPTFQLLGTILIELNDFPLAQIALNKGLALAKTARNQKAVNEINELLTQTQIQ